MRHSYRQIWLQEIIVYRWYVFPLLHVYTKKNQLFKRMKTIISHASNIYTWKPGSEAYFIQTWHLIFFHRCLNRSEMKAKQSLHANKPTSTCNQMSSNRNKRTCNQLKTRIVVNQSENIQKQFQRKIKSEKLRTVHFQSTRAFIKCKIWRWAIV